MALISSVYSNPLKHKSDVTSSERSKKAYKAATKSKKGKPTRICAVCDTNKPTKRLSKSDRVKYKAKLHPVCNECRDRLLKLGIYQSILGAILFKINHEYLDGDTEYKYEALPSDYYE